MKRPSGVDRSDRLVTPDGRYIAVRGRLWRATNPNLSEKVRSRLVKELMAARRDVGLARRRGDQTALGEAGARVEAVKVALGERGPVWWTDGAPDLNRRMARTTPYAEWFAAASAAEAEG